MGGQTSLDEVLRGEPQDMCVDTPWLARSLPLASPLSTPSLAEIETGVSKSMNDKKKTRHARDKTPPNPLRYSWATVRNTWCSLEALSSGHQALLRREEKVTD